MNVSDFGIIYRTHIIKLGQGLNCYNVWKVYIYFIELMVKQSYNVYYLG